MLELRATLFRKRPRYHLEYVVNDGQYSKNPSLAVFDNLADAALVLRYCVGGNLTGEDLQRATSILDAQDEKHNQQSQ